MKQRGSDGRFVRVPMEKRFWEYVDKSAGDEGCWLWTGPIGSAGYGRFTDYWQKYGAHRLSYTFANGPIPAGLHVCHRCDVRLCVNPRHLWLGSAHDNMQDAVAKGRHAGFKVHPGLKGSANAHAKLTDEQVLAIRAAYEPGRPGWPGRWESQKRVSVRALAEEYGVSPSLIHAVVTRKLWTHI